MATEKTLVASKVSTVSLFLIEQRHIINKRVMAGASGSETMAAMTELADGMIVEQYQDAIRQGGDTLASVALSDCCLVALGGYGRRELAPHSDIDLMFLFRPEGRAQIESLVRAVVHPLWDCKFQVGHSVRTIHDCIELAHTDATVKTSMMESRFLVGSLELFEQFYDRFTRKIVRKNIGSYLDEKLEERRCEYRKFGETVYLLEPNVKRSQGGLRDLHLLQWAGLARYQAQTIRELSNRGILSRADAAIATAAQDFLWRVRALLHTHAGTAQEILSFDEQVWLAEHFGFKDQPDLLAVEQFMQRYYQHTMGLHELCMRFLACCRKVSFWQRVAQFFPEPRVDTYFVVRRRVLTLAAEHRIKLLENPALLLRLFDVARSKNLTIAPLLLDDIHRHVDNVSVKAYQTPEVNQVFLAILAGPRTAKTLVAMHRASVLEKLVPAMGRVRGLMQFNQYHKYTVDQHSLLAVSSVEALGEESGVLGNVYRSVKRKDLLHLAVLFHDLGKGLEEDHSEVGKRLVEDVAFSLGFSEQDTRILSFLVHRHLLMAHTAFRRDPNDQKVILSFAREVGTTEVLKKLLVLTAADIAAVGPGVLTKWKEGLLIELYERTMSEISGDQNEAIPPEREHQIAQEVSQHSLLAGGGDGTFSWVEKQLAQFPKRYVYSTSSSRIAMHLSAVRRLHAGDVLVEVEFNKELETCEYTIVTFNDVIPGIFSKIAGVMAGSGVQIFDAHILTRADGIVVDTFQVMDSDYQGAPPAERLRQVGDRIASVLKGWEHVDDVLRRGARLKLTRSLPKAREATEVRVDNETSDDYTIIDVFADDRQGLLYVITNTIFQLGLSIHAARISTRLDQVVDVFYVADHQGKKLEDHGQLERLRTEVETAIENFLKAKAV